MVLPMTPTSTRASTARRVLVPLIVETWKKMGFVSTGHFRLGEPKGHWLGSAEQANFG